MQFAIRLVALDLRGENQTAVRVSLPTPDLGVHSKMTLSKNKKNSADPACIQHVRDIRERAGLSQADLARRSGLSRQVVSLVESGRITPSVLTALALAEVLDCTVDELFKKTGAEDKLAVTLGNEIRFQQGPVRMAQVGGRWLALPVAASETSDFGEADAQLISRKGKTGVVHALNPEAQLRHNLLVAGCDPALGIVRDLWKQNKIEGSVRWQNLPSSTALKAIAQKEAHIAGVHFPSEVSEKKALTKLGMSVIVIRFARWEQGWMLGRGNPLGFHSVEDLTSKHIRLLNRVEGSGSRLLLDELLNKVGVKHSLIPDYIKAAKSHFDCARAIQDGRADVAMGLRAVAESCDLDFLPVQEVSFNLIIPRVHMDFAPVARFLDFLQSRKLHRQLDCLPGYETSETGRQIHA